MHVQFGGLTDCPEGWLNFEPSLHLKASRVVVLGTVFARLSPFHFPREIRIGDIVKGLPLSAGEADVVFSSHVLEHLSYEDCRLALDNTFALLKPGGVFRFVVPDLKSRVKFYFEHADRLHGPANWLMQSTLVGRERRRQRGITGLLKHLFSTMDHQWMWDFETLKVEMERAHFIDVRRVTFGCSEDQMIGRVEKEVRFFWSPGEWPGVPVDLQGLRFPELAMEARKPA